METPAQRLWPGVLAALVLAATGCAQEAPGPAPAVEEALYVEQGVPEPTDIQLQRLGRELAELRVSVTRLQDSLDRFMETVVLELREENRRLRRAVRLRYEGRDGTLPSVPMPDRGLIDSVIQEGAPAMPPLELAPLEPREFTYVIVREWGRTPEAAALLDGEVSSLKGMVVAVPDWGTDDDLIALGRGLREEFGSYDNLNIEVYDNLRAAQAAAAGEHQGADRRVLSISKFKDTGRDLILLLRGGQVTPVS